MHGFLLTTLQALKTNYSMGSSIRIEPVGGVVYIRIGSIVDAAMIYNTMKKDHANLTVEYILPMTFGQVSPLHPRF
jgi:hypothetical protein